jgi:hypothetical protein
MIWCNDWHLVTDTSISAFIQRLLLCAPNILPRSHIVTEVHFEFHNFRVLFCYRNMEVLDELSHLLDIIVHVTHSFLQHFNLLAMLLHIILVLKLACLAAVIWDWWGGHLLRVEVALKKREYLGFDQIFVAWTWVDVLILLLREWWHARVPRVGPLVVVLCYVTVWLVWESLFMSSVGHFGWIWEFNDLFNWHAVDLLRRQPGTCV